MKTSKYQHLTAKQKEKKLRSFTLAEYKALPYSDKMALGFIL